MPRLLTLVSASVVLAASAACSPSPSTPTDAPGAAAPAQRADAGKAANEATANTGFALTAEERALFTSRLRCGDTLVEFAITEQGMADMRIANTVYAMRAVETASGAKYENLGHPDTTFWNQGTTAMVTIAGEALPECSVMPDDDVEAPPYSAQGNEPGWQLTIAGGSVRLVTDYGNTTVEAAISNEQRNGGIRTVRADSDSGPLQITVTPGGCRDSMSGDRYADTVTVAGQKRTLTGCGGAHWLRGIIWRLRSLNGSRAVGDTPPTLLFGGAGQMSGFAGCNRFTGSYTLEGERLAFSPAMAATKRGCHPEDLMQQETALLTALPAMSQATTNASGELVLSDGAGTQLVFDAESSP